MAKPLFQDIVPPDKKNIKKIPIPERSRSDREPMREPLPPLREKPAPAPVERPAARPPRREHIEREEVAPRPAPAHRTRKARRSKLPFIFTGIALVLIVAIIFVFLPKANGATVVLTPRGQMVAVNATFTASKDANAILPYQVAVYEKEGKLTVAATGTETVDIKATGIIRIYNDFSADPQKLVENTRFETPSGKIFRINTPVTIPGKKGDTPGSVEVAVTADKSGADYNVGLSDFTIPGFKGSAKYSKIYARTKSAIGGGFSGTRKKVDPSQVTGARQKIRDELQVSLVRQMQQNLPENFVFPPSAYFIEYESLPDTDISGGVQLAERATFHGIMFERGDLANVITEKVSGEKNAQNDLYGIDNLGFAAKTGTSTKPWESSLLNFTLNGTTTLVSAIDTDKLKNELVSKPRKSLSAVLTSYPGVAKATVMMRPFWKQSFPANPSEIMIEITPEPIAQ
jgi:hypothetical protein